MPDTATAQTKQRSKGASDAELKSAFRDVYFMAGNIREVAAQRLAANAFETPEARRFLEFFAHGKRSFARARRTATRHIANKP